MSVKAGWKQTTPFLIFCVVVYSWGDVLFGIETMPTSRTSIMNSVVFAGKLVGTAIFEPIAERFGYKYTMCLAAALQCVALVVQLTAKDWIVFTVGRIIAYLAVGVVENCVPSYISEISPAGVRGYMLPRQRRSVELSPSLFSSFLRWAFSCSSRLLLNRRDGWSARVESVRPYTRSTGKRVAGSTFSGEHISDDHRLSRCSSGSTNPLDCSSSTFMGRRSISKSALEPTLLPTMSSLRLVASLQPSTVAGNNTLIGSTVFILVGSKMFQCISFLMASEIGGRAMRKKFMGFGTSVDVLSAFIFSFCMPYLLQTPGANLGPKVGYLIGGNSFFALIFSLFYVPELAGRSLEEMDERFEMRLWAWQFKKAETKGVGARITQLEAGQRAVGKADQDDTKVDDEKQIDIQREFT
ncbi:hypothetical protein IAU59_005524 [Kwoniella sp. CBS 9459]